jgi:hypothetical protein
MKMESHRQDGEMKSKNDKIQSAVEFLQDLPADEVLPAFFAPDGSYEESVLIGTGDSYIRMAIKLLKIAQAGLSADSRSLGCDEDDIDGKSYLYTNEIKEVFDEFGDVWPVCAYIAKDADEMQKLKKYFES